MSEPWSPKKGLATVLLNSIESVPANTAFDASAFTYGYNYSIFLVDVIGGAGVGSFFVSFNDEKSLNDIPIFSTTAALASTNYLFCFGCPGNYLVGSQMTASAIVSMFPFNPWQIHVGIRAVAGVSYQLNAWGGICR